jgi:hypothetical protein
LTSRQVKRPFRLVWPKYLKKIPLDVTFSPIHAVVYNKYLVMHIEIIIPVKTQAIEIFVYNIPPWLICVIVVCYLIASLLGINPF